MMICRTAPIKYLTKIVLAAFNDKGGKDDIFESTNVNDSLQ
jgi:hypothetical protein